MTPPVKQFTDLALWRRSHQLPFDLAKDLGPSPLKRRVAIMTDQILGRVGSGGAKIAEGFNRSQKKYLNSLPTALGEAAETKNWLYKLRNAGFLEKELVNAPVREGPKIQKMLSGLIRSIRDSNTERRCFVLCALCFLLSTRYSVLGPVLRRNVASCYLYQ